MLGFLLLLCFGFGGPRTSLFNSLTLAFLCLRDRFLLPTTQGDHARVFRVLRSIASGRFDRLPLLATIVVFSAIKRRLRSRMASRSRSSGESGGTFERL